MDILMQLMHLLDNYPYSGWALIWYLPSCIYCSSLQIDFWLNCNLTLKIAKTLERLHDDKIATITTGVGTGLLSFGIVLHILLINVAPRIRQTSGCS